MNARDTFLREVEVEGVSIVIHPSWKLAPIPEATWRFAMLMQLNYRAVGTKKILRFAETIELGQAHEPTLLDILQKQGWEVARLKPHQNGEESSSLVAKKPR